MTFHVFTIFPEAMNSYFNVSILARAQKNKKIKIKIYDIRKFTKDKHKRTDEKPFGGGAGMVMKVEPIVRAVNSAIKKTKKKNFKYKTILLSAKGKQFNQKIAHNYSNKFTDIFLICGRYEGVDERVKKILKAEEMSIGPYVLTDGEVAAMAIVSSVARLVPGVIRLESLQEESHWNLMLAKERGGWLEYPHYTRPEVFEHNGKKYRTPKVLLSGNHKKIAEWRKKNSKS
ncbi:tRNA (guanosine(37)-N1)-methyltransferase TrmD [Patescibacteria group bacterium]